MVTVLEALGMVEEVSVRLARGKSKDSFAVRLRQFLDCKEVDLSSVENTQDHEERKNLQAWMQGVYDELKIICEVPLPPILTQKQKKALKKFDLRLFYLPGITEDHYPSSFVKINWKGGGLLDYISQPSKSFSPGWIVIETIPKLGPSNHSRTPIDSQDGLAKALKIATRFTWRRRSLTEKKGIFFQFAKITGFPKKSVRLPFAEEWNFLANLFLWLNANRDETLPKLSAQESSEWTENRCRWKDTYLVIGKCSRGLSSVGTAEDAPFDNDSNQSVCFRLLVKL